MQEGPAAIADRQQQRLAALEQKLQQVSSLVRHGPTELQNRVAIASFTLPGISPQELAALLDSAARVQVRSGIHCAPRMHQALGTSPAGTVRMSLGHSTTDEEITTAIAVLAEIAESFA
ncbi:MAG: aminotransferase class V-fold PLP-dependent enzyme [Pirellulales bacterium]